MGKLRQRNVRETAFRSSAGLRACCIADFQAVGHSTAHKPSQVGNLRYSRLGGRRYDSRNRVDAKPPVRHRGWHEMFGVGIVLGLVLAIAPARAQDNESSGWAQHIWLGPQVAFNISAKFSLSGQFPISGSQPGAAGVSGVDHLYDDGYVRVDQTGNAQGYTSYWGYQSPAQNDAANHALLMHSATAYSASASSTKDDEPYLGLQLGYGTEPWSWGESLHFGFEFGFGWLPIRINANQPLPAMVDQSTYSFDTGGIVMPTAPYNGGPSGIGPTIHDVATALGTSTVAGTVGGTRGLDTSLYTFRLGPSVHWDLGRYFVLSASVGGALAIVSGDLKWNEQISLPDGTTALNSGKIGSTDVVYGGYVSATALAHIGEHADIYVSAEYMPLGNSSISSGGRQAELDLGDAVYVSAGLNWPF